MFTPEARSQLRSNLLEYAARDKRISGAAMTGSAAAEREDGWSDIDLAFGVTDAAKLSDVLSDWTKLMYEEYSAVHHVDVKSGAWIYRVFLLASTLQVDLAFAPATDFRPLAASFRLMFGSANKLQDAQPPLATDIIGVGWLYALHARSCIARRRLWQAEYMISGVRDHALMLACLRNGLPTVHGRGIDQLSREVTAKFESALVCQLDPDELLRALRAAISGLIGEIQSSDQGLSPRLEMTVASLGDLPDSSLGR